MISKGSRVGQIGSLERSPHNWDDASNEMNAFFTGTSERCNETVNTDVEQGSDVGAVHDICTVEKPKREWKDKISSIVVKNQGPEAVTVNQFDDIMEEQTQQLHNSMPQFPGLFSEMSSFTNIAKDDMDNEAIVDAFTASDVAASFLQIEPPFKNQISPAYDDKHFRPILRVLKTYVKDNADKVIDGLTPMAIISDCNPKFFSEFWKKLFEYESPIRYAAWTPRDDPTWTPKSGSELLEHGSSSSKSEALRSSSQLAV